MLTPSIHVTPVYQKWLSEGIDSVRFPVRGSEIMNFFLLYLKSRQANVLNAAKVISLSTFYADNNTFIIKALLLLFNCLFHCLMNRN